MSVRTVARFALVGLLGMSLAAPAAAQNPPSTVKEILGRFGTGGFLGIDPPAEVAPMPRPMPRQVAHIMAAPRLTIFSHLPPPLIPEVAPMPRVVPVVRHCAEEEIFQTEGARQVVAPMPREKNAIEVEFGIELGGGPLLFGRGPGGFDFTPAAAAPMPRQVPNRVPHTFELFIENPVPARDGAGQAFRVAGAGCCTVATRAPGTPPADMRVVYPLVGVTAIRCDETGTWWVETNRVPQPKHSSVRGNGPVSAAIGGCIGSSAGMAIGMRENPAASSRFAGTWVREMEGIVVAATLSPCGEELKLCMTQHAEGHMVCLTVTADCKVTKEGLLHGAITGVDVNAKRDPKATGDSPLGMEMAEMAMGIQELVDAPFSFRMKQTSAGLMVSNLKMGSVGPVSAKELAILCGMFKPCKDGAMPTPKPMKTHVGEMTLPTGRYLEHYPQYFSPDPTHPLPRELASQEDPDGAARRATGAYGTVSPTPVAPARPVVVPARSVAPAPRACGTPPPMCPAPSIYVPQGFCPSVSPAGAYGPAPLRLPGAPQAGWSPVQPANVPGSEFDMMADVFGQMLGVKQPLPCVPPPPAMLPPPVQPAGLYLPPGSSYPQAGAGYGLVPSMVPSVSTSPLPQAKPSLTGTWVREVGPVVYVVKIAPDHLTITATAATEVGGGKLMTQELVLTADYHLSRDGTTLVGLITGVDSTVNGELTGDSHADLQALQEELSQLQKTYVDKPYAMGVRVYEDSLVIGNVRLPQAKDVQDGDTPLGIIGGRYKNAAGGSPPKPKVRKTGPVRSLPPDLSDADLVRSLPPPAVESPYAPAPTCSSPRPNDRIPPPFPGEAPRTRLGPPATVCPAPGAVPRELDALTLPPDNRIPPPSPRVTEPAVPPMAVPTPPVIETPKTKKQRKKAAAEAERVKQLLYQSEDIRQIQDVWRRFWFNDQPSHLTPERIHSGIR